MLAASDSKGRAAPVKAPELWTGVVQAQSLRLRIAWLLIPILCGIALAIAIQLAAGAYHAEFAAYPDEPAHVVTSLSLDHYIRTGFPESPIQYFENYYLHYPKVAIGHWPPLLYAVETIGTLLLRPSRASLLIVQAVLAGILAAFLFRLIVPAVGPCAGAIGSAVLLVIPIMEAHTVMVMAEILLTLTIFAACVFLARFVESGRTRDALWLALWLSAAILTKASGWALVLAPPLILLLTRRWEVLWKPGLWIASGLVAIICLPWQLATARMVAMSYENPAPNWQYASQALMIFTKVIWELPGIPFSVLAVASLYFFTRQAFRGQSGVLGASMVSLVLAFWVFYIIVPAGIEARKMIVIVPAVLVLAAFGAAQLASRFFPQRARMAAGVLFTCASLLVAIPSFPIPRKEHSGYIAAAGTLARLMPLDSAVLVSTGAEAEGALISEFALVHANPDRYFVRASKFLSAQSWDGAYYRSFVHSEDECSRLLATVPISFVVIDLRPELTEEAHQILRSLVTSRPLEWKLVWQFVPDPHSRPMIALYASTRGVKPVENLSIDMQKMIGGTLSAPRTIH